MPWKTTETILSGVNPMPTLRLSLRWLRPSFLLLPLRFPLVIPRLLPVLLSLPLPP